MWLKKRKQFKPIDIEAGAFTYGQRLELAKIFSKELHGWETLSETLTCLHGEIPRISLREKMAYFEKIVAGLTLWAKKEHEMLHYEATQEEISAGIKEYSQKVGELATVKQIAKAFSIDPDTVLGWEYVKVFGILYTDLEEAKFQRKVEKEYERKYRHK